MAFIVGVIVGLAVFLGFRNLIAAVASAIFVVIAGFVILAVVTEWQRKEADEDLRGEERARVPPELVGTWKGKFEETLLIGHGVKLRITIREGKVGENVAEIVSSGKLTKGKCRAEGELESAYERRIVLRAIEGKCESAFNSYTLTIEPPEKTGGKPRVTFRDGTFEKVG